GKYAAAGARAGNPRVGKPRTGRGGEIRTRDPHNPIVVRYQAALRPDRRLASPERGSRGAEVYAKAGTACRPRRRNPVPPRAMQELHQAMRPGAGVGVAVGRERGTAAGLRA